MCVSVEREGISVYVWGLRERESEREREREREKERDKDWRKKEITKNKKE